ncbi:hypothetical protein P3T20_004549 [Paraburkholderia sp. GAS206C]|jgi:hypothetical protein
MFPVPMMQTASAPEAPAVNFMQTAHALKAPAFSVTTDDQLDTYDTYGPLPPPADDVPVMPKYTCRP